MDVTVSQQQCIAAVNQLISHNTINSVARSRTPSTTKLLVMWPQYKYFGMFCSRSLAIFSRFILFECSFFSCHISSVTRYMYSSAPAEQRMLHGRPVISLLLTTVITSMAAAAAAAIHPRISSFYLPGSSLIICRLFLSRQCLYIRRLISHIIVVVRRSSSYRKLKMPISRRRST